MFVALKSTPDGQRRTDLLRSRMTRHPWCSREPVAFIPMFKFYLFKGLFYFCARVYLPVCMSVSVYVHMCMKELTKSRIGCLVSEVEAEITGVCEPTIEGAQSKL